MHFFPREDLVILAKVIFGGSALYIAQFGPPREHLWNNHPFVPIPSRGGSFNLLNRKRLNEHYNNRVLQQLTMHFRAVSC